MARKVITVLSDDLDGTESDEVTTVTFSLNGSSYSIDLAPKNRAKMEKALDPFIEKATKVRGGSSTSRGSSSKKVSRSDLDAIREWARSNGYTVGDRGRIKAEIIDAYEVTH